MQSFDEKSLPDDDFIEYIRRKDGQADFLKKCSSNPTVADEIFARTRRISLIELQTLLVSKDNGNKLSPIETIISVQPLMASKWINDLSEQDKSFLINLLKYSNEHNGAPLIIMAANRRPRVLTSIINTLKTTHPGKLLQLLTITSHDRSDAISTACSNVYSGFDELANYLLSNATNLYFDSLVKPRNNGDTCLHITARHASHNFLAIVTHFYREKRINTLIKGLIQPNSYGESPLKIIYCYQPDCYKKLTEQIPQLSSALKAEIIELEMARSMLKISGVIKAIQSSGRLCALLSFIKYGPTSMVVKSLSGVHFGLTIFDVVDMFPANVRAELKICIQNHNIIPEFNMLQLAYRRSRWALGQVSWQVPALSAPNSPDISSAKTHKELTSPVMFSKRRESDEGLSKPVPKRLSPHARNMIAQRAADSRGKPQLSPRAL